MTDAAKIFTILIIFSGLSVVGYGVTNLVSLFFEGEFKTAWRKTRMEAKIKELKDHYIHLRGRDVGSTVIKSFKENSVNFVVIDENEKRPKNLSNRAS
jgi:voltage-gated potassium channel